MVVRRLQLIVFDLDYTLWPFWVDTDVMPPFTQGPAGQIIDSTGDVIACYPEVSEILKRLYEKGYTLAVASRTGEAQSATQLMELFDWNKYITYREIYPGRKVTHFDNFQLKSGISLEHMLFFDDEQRNINDIRNLGVTSVLVKNGLTAQIVDEGLDQYEREH